MDNPITTLTRLINELSTAPDSELVFKVEGTDIRPDYHVTEVKLAQVNGLDCGQQTAEWDESLVQLLDGPTRAHPEAGFMLVSTFLKIASAGNSAVKAYAGGELYFEFSSGNQALRKLAVQNVSIKDGRTYVELGPVAATCKPAFRNQTEAAIQPGCCASTPERATPQGSGSCC